MLTLERKEDEVISVTHNGEKLDIHVTMVRDNKVKLSFDAPESFEIWRDEIGESQERNTFNE